MDTDKKDGDTGSVESRLDLVLEASLLGRVSCALRTWLANPALEVELEMTERNGMAAKALG